MNIKKKEYIYIFFKKHISYIGLAVLMLGINLVANPNNFRKENMKICECFIGLILMSISMSEIRDIRNMNKLFLLLCVFGFIIGLIGYYNSLGIFPI